MKRHAAAALVGLALGLLAAPVNAQTFAAVPVFPEGLHYGRLARDGEAAVRYAISIPPKYDRSHPVPLVLALHFGGNPAGAGNAVLKALVRPALEELGAIIVAPDSSGGGWDTPDNDRAVDLLLEQVLASYAIDRKKMVVTGFSMGGRGAWSWAAKYPDRFSAAVPVAGRPPESLEGWRVPVMAVHSVHDTVVPIAPTQEAIAKLRSAGVRAEMIVLSGPDITKHTSSSTDCRRLFHGSSRSGSELGLFRERVTCEN
jgi:poly(3-hydroxybutyrate) depolymerase